MWTQKGREALLNGALTALSVNPKITFYDDGVIVASSSFDAPPVIVNSALVFGKTEAVVIASRQPKTAVIYGAGHAILELAVGVDVMIDPANIVAGSLLKIDELIIG